MRSSETINELAAALAQAQGEYPIIAKSHTAVIPTKAGGEYSYSYADLADTVEAAHKINAQHGLSVAQFPEWDGIEDVLTTRVMHSSGQWMEASMRLFMGNDDPQSHGSALTYGRRYAYCAALGIVADTDDDGAAATRATGSAGGSIKAPSDKQLSFLNSLLFQTGQDLFDLKDVIGREVVTAPDLSSAECKKLIDHLLSIRDGKPAPRDVVPPRGESASKEASTAQLNAIRALQKKAGLSDAELATIAGIALDGLRKDDASALITKLQDALTDPNDPERAF